MLNIRQIPGQVQSVRGLHGSFGCLSKVSMSKFETDKYLPYEKLEKNLEVVRKR